MLRSLFIDFNSYFASVEQQIHPELRGKPIAVVPVLADTTSAIAASYEAKRCGVQTGTLIAEAKRLCPDLILVKAQHRAYVEYHHRLVEVVESVIHVDHVMSIDEMACSLIGSMCNREKAVAIAMKVKSAIAEGVGSELRCSIGIAPNDFLAKTASDMKKPDGLIVIELDQLPDILFTLELRDLVGIGPRMYNRLFKHGIYSVKSLCTASVEQLRLVWGGIEGERMWLRLRGEHVPYIETHTSSISHSHVLPPDLRSRQGADGVLHRLLQKAATRMRSNGLVTGHIAIKISFREGFKWKHDLEITPTQDSIQLTAILSKVLAERPYEDATPLKVAVELTKLNDLESLTLPMFANTGPARDKLNNYLDKLNSKYGKNTVYVGTAWNALNSSPLRIAFNHIPDIEKEE